MASFIYLQGVKPGILSHDGADVVAERFRSGGAGFIAVTLGRVAHDDDLRTGFIRADGVTDVEPIHDREYASKLDDPPDWYSS